MLRRRVRVVVGLLAMLVVILLASGASAREGSQRLPGMLGVLAFFPVIANVPLGFRGHRENLELLKTLPLTPVRLAIGQITIPVLLIAGAQLLAVLAFAGMGQLAPRWIPVALVTLPLLDLGVVALVETFTLGRDPRQAGFLWATLQMLAIVVTLVPAGLAVALVLDATGEVAPSLAAGWLVHALVVLGLVRVLGWRFARWEPGS